MMAYNDPRRASFAAVIRRAVHETDVRVWMRPDENGSPEPTRRVTGLREYRLLTIGGKGSGYRVLVFQDIEANAKVVLRVTTGTTVWTRHPSPKTPLAPTGPTPVQVADLQGEVKRLRAEVARLKDKYETPCKGLVKHYGPDDVLGHKIVPCGGFMGHPGDCAEVW